MFTKNRIQIPSGIDLSFVKVFFYVPFCSSHVRSKTNSNKNKPNKLFHTQINPFQYNTGSYIHCSNLFELSYCTTPFNSLCRPQTSCKWNANLCNTSKNNNSRRIASFGTSYNTITLFNSNSLSNYTNFNVIITIPTCSLLYNPHIIITTSYHIQYSYSPIDLVSWI